MDLEELERRRRKSHSLKRAVWMVPMYAVALVAATLQDGHLDRVLLLGLVAVCYGAFSAYRIGVRWERRWQDLINERSMTEPR